MLLQQLLVPVDFSEPSEKALSFAIELGQALQARLLLLHVIETPVLGGGPGGVGMAPADAEVMEQIEEDANRGLDRAIERGRQAGLECTGKLIHGAPFQQIINIAEHQPVDLIVMGTRGHTGLKHIVLGSVAEKTVRMAPCPVVVTPSDGHEDSA